MLRMNEHFRGLFLDSMYQEIQDFSKRIMQSANIKWESNKYYTFVIGDSRVIDHNKALVLYQKVSVIEVDDELSGEDLGEYAFCIYVGQGELYDSVFEYKTMPEYSKESLNHALNDAMLNVVEGYGNGESIEGVRFIANRNDLILSTEGILDEFVQKFGEKFGLFYVDIMSETDIEDGNYLMEFKMREVVYENDEEGWKVLINVGMENTDTKEKKEVEMEYITGLEKTNNDPKLEEFRGGVDYITDSFVEQYPEWDDLGIYMFFDEKRKEEMQLKYEIRKYKKIQGKDEDMEHWFGRFEDFMYRNKKEFKNVIRDFDVKDNIGVFITFINDVELVLNEGGIMTTSGKEIYIKKDMNLQKGLRNLSQLIGRNNLTLNIMRVYDYRKKVKEGV